MALKFTINLPPSPPRGPSTGPATDLDKRVVTAAVDGVEQPPVDLAANAPSFELTVNAGQQVKVTYVDVDQSGNVSPVSPPLEFTAADTVPPPQPLAPVIGDVSET